MTIPSLGSLALSVGRIIPTAVVVSFIALQMRIRLPSGVSEQERGRVAQAKDNMVYC
jgi:hypothetical protein